MTNGSPINPVQTTGRYLVVLPEGEESSGMSALMSATGSRDIDDSVMSNLGVAVVALDPNQLQSLNAAVAGSQPILAAEPEQIMYAIGGSSISGDTANYLQGYKQGITNLVDSLSNGGVTAGQQVTTSNFSDGNTATWGLQATKAINSNYTGAGIKVAVLDTGLDLTHPDFAGRTITSQSFIAGEEAQDRNGHGTHCIGTSCGSLNPANSPSSMRYGVAYNAEIFAGKVLSDQGAGRDQGILNGIDWAISNGCQIISMSLGVATRPGTQVSQVYEIVAQRALARGILIIAAAGNGSLDFLTGKRRVPPSPVARPANCPSIMAVAALDSQLQIAPFSNGSINPNGGGVDIAGPGVDVYSTYSTDAVPQLDQFGGVRDPNLPSRYKSLNGTSMATPHVAGLAALYAEATGKRGLELWALLMRDPQRLVLPSTDVGIGLVQAPV